MMVHFATLHLFTALGTPCTGMHAFTAKRSYNKHRGRGSVYTETAEVKLRIQTQKVARQRLNKSHAAEALALYVLSPILNDIFGLALIAAGVEQKRPLCLREQADGTYVARNRAAAAVGSFCYIKRAPSNGAGSVSAGDLPRAAPSPKLETERSPQRSSLLSDLDFWCDVGLRRRLRMARNFPVLCTKENVCV